MKKTLWLLSMAACAQTAFAQQAGSFNKTVFAGYKSWQAVGSGTAQRQQKDWQAKLPGWGADLNKLTGMPRDMYGPALSVPGSSINDKLQYCFSTILPAVGIDASEWQQSSVNNTPVGQFARYEQYFAGHKVAFAKLTIQFTNDGKLLRVLNNSYGGADNSLAPAMSRQDALAAATQDLAGATFTAQHADADWVWFPVPSQNGYELHPAWAFHADGSIKTTELQLTGYVDALDGTVLYRDNNVKETFDMKVKGDVFKQNPTLASSVEPLANLMITIGSTNYYTDTAGQINIPTLNAPQTGTVKLQGRWSIVRAVTSSNTTPSFSYTGATNGTIYTFATTAPSSQRHVNAYYHVNRVHDYMKTFYPTFNNMDIALQTNVDVTGTCNAYYNGSSINFYAAGGGCNSFANCGDIIYHEYGHGISDKFYNWQGANTIVNGALNEGNSDIWGISITHDPVLGKGSTPAGGIIRRYDQAPKVYPTDIQGEVHADGEIIAGAWWDVAVNIGNADTMTRLFTSTYYATPDGPNGTEGTVYHDVLIAALLADDNDNNLSNGTPHFTAIVTAFAKHGIYLLADATVTHTEVPHQPAGTVVPITATVNLSNPPFFQGLKLFYKKRGAISWDSTLLTNTGGTTFTGQLPAQAKGTIVDYYFAVYDLLAVPNVFFPVGFNPTISPLQSTIPYQYAVGVKGVDSNHFETDKPNWKIGNNTGDNATGGIWIRAIPVGSYVTTANGQLPCQVANDHTLNNGTGACLVTGNAASTTASINSADVDNGTTTVISPVYDITGYKNPMIEYYRWYSNDRGSNARTDKWTVQMKDSTSSFWFQTVDQTYQSDYNWRRRIFAVKDYLPSAQYIHLKFVAEDLINTQLPQNGQSTVEAAVDDFMIYDEADNAGVDNTAVLRADIYPNPADDYVKIVLPQNAAAGSISLYDITGKLVVKTPVTAAGREYNIITKQLAAGQYFLMIQSGKTIQTRKLAVTH